MRHTRFFFPLCCGALAMSLALGTAWHAPSAAAGAPQGAGKYVYADFEESKEGRPISRRGGLVQLTSYQERPANPVRFKGLAGSNPPAPELVRLRKDDPNHAAAFDYTLAAPNQYAGVGLEVHGEPDKDGKPVADDLSGYKDVTLQVYATGVTSLRLEVISRGQGLGTPDAFPQAAFKVTPGFNTYRVPLKALFQPSWAQPRVSTKEVLRKLTAVGVSAYCNDCAPATGTIIVDNITFEN